ncbi:MAG TPA: DDE domain-containing protein [Gammaproteobacteria bacterium]|nr:DDE domain-containing protein [Gammaproteobacteria bacterium]HIL97413.1 DDE domain-containing protein [Pseudomonadales bacterium]
MNQRCTRDTDLRTRRPPKSFIWRAIDQDGEVVDVFLQNRRDAKALIQYNWDNAYFHCCMSGGLA